MVGRPDCSRWGRARAGTAAKSGRSSWRGVATTGYWSNPTALADGRCSPKPCSAAARLRYCRGRALPRPKPSPASPPQAATAPSPRFTDRSAPQSRGQGERCARDRFISTPGKGYTSSTTKHGLARLPKPPHGSVRNGSWSMMGGSQGAETIVPVLATGRPIPSAIHGGWHRSRKRSSRSGWSSVCGSNPKWSIPTASSTATTLTGC